MEQQIQDLVASIRKEGIEKANADAARIISEANEKAKAIVDEAKKESEKMILDAKAQIDTDRASSEASIKQSARNVSLSLQKNIEDTYSAILQKECADAMHGDALISILKTVIPAELSGKVVELSAKDISELAEKLSSEFALEIKTGLEFKPSSSVSSGFRITEKDGSGYIDLSGESVAALIFPYLSPSLKAIIQD